MDKKDKMDKKYRDKMDSKENKVNYPLKCKKISSGTVPTS